MQTLQILSNNNFGQQFWKKNAEVKSDIEINPINFSIFKHLIEADKKIILVDFYYSKLTLQEENDLIRAFCDYSKQVSQSLKLFILSPIYACLKLETHKQGPVTIVKHHYTAQFLSNLSLTNNKISFINQ